MNSHHDNEIDNLIERCDVLSRALVRSELDDPYSDETAALSEKLMVARSSLRQARVAVMTAAADDLSGLLAYARITEHGGE